MQRTKELQMVAVEPERLVHVLQEPAGRRDEDVHARQPLLLMFEVLATNDEAGGEVVLVANLAEHFEDLDGLREVFRVSGAVLKRTLVT